MSPGSHTEDTWPTDMKMNSTSLQGHLVPMHDDLLLCVTSGHRILHLALHHFKDMESMYMKMRPESHQTHAVHAHAFPQPISPRDASTLCAVPFVA